MSPCKLRTSHLTGHVGGALRALSPRPAVRDSVRHRVPGEGQQLRKRQRVRTVPRGGRDPDTSSFSSGGPQMGAGPASPPPRPPPIPRKVREAADVSRTQKRGLREDSHAGPRPRGVNPEETSSILDPSPISKPAGAGRGGAEAGRPERLILLYKLVIGSGSCGSGHCAMFPTRWIVRPGSFHSPSSHVPLLLKPHPSASPSLPEFLFLARPPLYQGRHPERHYYLKMVFNY